MLLLLQVAVVVVVAVQVLLVLFHKRHLNMDIAISANKVFLSPILSPALS